LNGIGQFGLKFQVEWVVPTNPSYCRETRCIDPSGIQQSGGQEGHSPGARVQGSPSFRQIKQNNFRITV